MCFPHGVGVSVDYSKAAKATLMVNRCMAFVFVKVRGVLLIIRKLNIISNCLLIKAMLKAVEV
jgi:hypothetical protein